MVGKVWVHAEWLTVTLWLVGVRVTVVDVVMMFHVVLGKGLEGRK